MDTNNKKYIKYILVIMILMIILIIIIEFGLARIYGHTAGESPAIGVKSWFIRNYAYRIGLSLIHI